MPELCIIADDLTGAMDTGVQFAREGIPTELSLGRALAANESMSAYEVMVFDTESRHISPAEAAGRVSDVVRWAQESGFTRFYKKTDSTLRGNIGAELEALMAATRQDKIAFVPAYPKGERYTRKGLQYIKGQLVHETAMGSDPLEPVTTSNIPEILARQTNREAHILGSGSFAEVFAQLSPGIVVCDCRSNDDLLHIGQSLKQADALQVLAGSAGLAGILPDLLSLKQERQTYTIEKRPLLLLNGSLNEVALTQIGYARRVGIKEVVIPPQVLLSEEACAGSAGRSIIEQVIKMLRKSENVMLRTLENRSDLQSYLAESGIRAYDRNTIHSSAATNMGKLMHQVVRNFHAVNLAIFGGDTLNGVMTALGIAAIRLLDEISPGVALSEITFMGERLTLVSKSGAFGTEDLVIRIVDYLDRLR